MLAALTTRSGTPAAAAPALLSGFVSGQVLNSANRPLGQSDVYLFDDSAATGTTASIAHGRSLADGTFRLSIPDPRTATGNGWHNYTLMTIHDGRFGVRFFSRLQAGATTADKAEIQADAQADAITARQPAVLHATMRSSGAPAETVRGRTADLAEQANQGHDADQLMRSAVVTATYQNVPTTVARIEIISGSTVTFTYGTQSDTDVDVGVQVEGTSGWSIDGSTHLSKSGASSAPLPYTVGMNSWPVAFYMAVGITYSDNYLCAGKYYCYTKRSADYWTGAVHRYATAWNGCLDVNARCQRYVACFPPNGGFDKHSGVNQKYATAAKVAGLTLGASSGWSTSVDVKYDFQRPQDFVAWPCIAGKNNWITLASELYVFGTTTPN
jgi:hypothetical protein